MSARAFTPGPWQGGGAQRASNFGGYHVRVGALKPAPTTVAKVYGGPEDQREVAEANARLIIAAPAYDTAAEKCIAGAVEIGDPDFVAVRREDVEALRAALRAARGES